MIAWFTKNHVAANLLLVTLLLSGLFSLSSKIPLEVFPSFETDMISVGVSLRGATPEDVEQGVTIRIEEAVQDLEGIKQIFSRSSEGSGSVTIEVESGYDPRELLADIKSRVDAINTFPGDAEKPIVALAERKREVIAVTVSSDYGEKETREYAEKVRDQILRLPNVTQVELSGVRDYELAIEVSQDTLRQYSLSLAQISSAIANSSSDISAGNLKTEGGEAMQIIQVMRHLTTFVYGQFLAKQGHTLAELRSCSSPIYQLELMMVGRLFAQSPELYTDIMLAQFDNVESLLAQYQSLFSQTLEKLKAGDKSALIDAFADAKSYFSDSTAHFLTQSRSLLNKANDAKVLD